MAGKKTGKTEAVAKLGRVSLFGGLSGRQLGAIAAAAKELERAEGAVLVREGETGVGFYLVLEGTARVTVRGRTVTNLRPGDYFGEISLLDGGPRTATVTATSPVRMLGLTAWAFQAVIRKHPSVALRLLETLASHVRNSAKGADQL